MPMRHKLHEISITFVIATLLPLPAMAQPADEFYRNKQISMLVASGAGGGYDVYARAFARYVTRHIPGNPVIVARNIV